MTGSAGGVRAKGRGGAGRRELLFLATVCLFSSAPLRAQESLPLAPELIDRIVAVVGETAILLSDVNERVQQARSGGMQVPEDSVQLLAMQRQILQTLIDDELVYQRARRDTSIQVTDQEVANAVDQQYRTVRAQFRTEPEFLAAIRGAGWPTIEEYRRYLTEQSRRAAYAERFVDRQKRDGKLRAGIITDEEMRAFFDEARRAGQLPRLPATISFRQVVLSPRPSDSARVRAFRLADSLRAAIEAGADFAEIARRFSDDLGSRETGGDLGFFRRGTMVRRFEDVAFNLRVGPVSPPVETEYGWHLIKVDRASPGEIKARHILVSPVISAAEQAVARRLADSVAALVRAGASIDSLARAVGDSAEYSSRAVTSTNRDSLPTGYARAFANAQVGTIAGPAPLNPEVSDSSRVRWFVARVTDLKPARDPDFEDLREQVRQRLIEQKGFRNMIEDLRRQTYVDIRL